MRQFTHAFLAACLLLAGPAVLTAQEGGPAHAPDGRAPQLIAPLYISPKPNAPFTATAKTTSVRTLPDGSTVTAENSRMVTRDGEGRIFQQRVTFVPVPNDGKREMWVHATDYYDPAEHTHYHCDTGPKTCDLVGYFAQVNDSMTLAQPGLQPDQTTFVTREDLGVDTFAGLEVQRSRETTTLYKEVDWEHAHHPSHGRLLVLTGSGGERAGEAPRSARWGSDTVAYGDFVDRFRAGHLQSSGRLSRL